METTSEELGFLSVICGDPDNDHHRLVFADWLEEHGGDPVRAEFIRLQVKLAGLSPRRFRFGEGDGHTAEVMRDAGPDYWVFHSHSEETVRVGDRVDVRRYLTHKQRSPIREREVVYKGLLVTRIDPDADGYGCEYTVKRDAGSVPWEGEADWARMESLFLGDLGDRLRNAHPYLRHTVRGETYTGRTDDCCLYERGFPARVTVDAEKMNRLWEVCWDPDQQVQVYKGDGNEAVEDRECPRTALPVTRITLVGPPSRGMFFVSEATKLFPHLRGKVNYLGVVRRYSFKIGDPVGADEHGEAVPADDSHLRIGIVRGVRGLVVDILTYVGGSLGTESLRIGRIP